MQERIAVIGLGYVGLPLALAFAQKFPGTIGFDNNNDKVASLKNGIAPSGEVSTEALKTSTLKFTSDSTDLTTANFFVVTVPTPIDQLRRPNLQPLIIASQTIGQILQIGSVIVYESTVYPGVTEEICRPILARESGLNPGIDFKVGYSPERINPGDSEHTIERIVKIVSAEDSETLERIARVYEAIIEAGIYRATSIKTAEAAKVIENIQRDLNIALMNELALICDRLGIRTRDVLAAARTKWNFVPFQPGLVGGHCIGVDPYYLTAKAEELRYYPEIILAGRRINDNMGFYVGQRLLKLLATHRNVPIKQARIGILGITFKENVRDIRNSRVPDIVEELKQFGIEPLVHDPLADAGEVKREYGIELKDWHQLLDLDVLVLAVIHRYYLEITPQKLFDCLQSGGIFMDVKSAIAPAVIPAQIIYWSL